MSATPHADPGWGVFETMLVIAGRAVELDAHVERLRTSVAALYGATLPDSAPDLARNAASGIEHGKVRLTVVPVGARMEVRVSAEEVEAASVFPGGERAASLRGFIVEGGLGEHKWADRRLLDRLAAAAPAGELPLLLEADGTVLEASRASVFAVRDERLLTPPTDGRILPSIARLQTLEVAREVGIEVSEEPLALDELRDEEAFLTGSVRGIEPVGAIDGGPLAPPGEVSSRIAAGLRSRWLRAPAAAHAAAAGGGRPAGRPGW
ncbi:MAG TPA: aminotransferase class IV [Solirubrobacterales bacterium]|nr:aminotransferase class IV [Solirubrobacterales bacterium]